MSCWRIAVAFSLALPCSRAAKASLIELRKTVTLFGLVLQLTQGENQKYLLWSVAVLLALQPLAECAFFNYNYLKSNKI
jgi:hypothetical protein